MSKILRAMTIVLLVASCGLVQPRAPRDLETACKILKES